ncbi:MAG: hypothetical protein RIR14_1038, partial [Pseudomonadota bacterium]
MAGTKRRDSAACPAFAPAFASALPMLSGSGMCQPGAGGAVDQVARQMVRPAAGGLPDIGHLHHGATGAVGGLGPGFTVFE